MMVKARLWEWIQAWWAERREGVARPEFLPPPPWPRRGLRKVRRRKTIIYRICRVSTGDGFR